MSNPSRALPAGTVTFLFTDIEGSTRMAQQHRRTWEAMRDRHHAILRAALESHGGYVFEIVGDAFCAAFHRPEDALLGALRGQRDLQAEPWGEVPIRVRMGIHTGVAEPDGERYRGYLALSSVARVMSVAHGGQVLLSQAAFDLVEGDLPDDVILRDMGEHRLKDLLRRQHLYQPVAADLLSDFPPLKSLDAHLHNLPIQLTSFIGREREILELSALIGRTRLITLTGVGGSGKTRLALQVAAEVLDQFADGAWLIELAPLSDPALVPQTIATALNVHEQPGRAVVEVLKDHLGDKQLLLVLDNCEHLIGACAHIADALLRAAPKLKILATSREALGVAGETNWPVPSLSLPNPGEFRDPDRLTQYEALRLFLDRAALVAPHFELTRENAAAVAQICFRLDGIPLALELAAARVTLLSADQISARLDDRFRLLTGGARTALPRHQTLRSLIDWSYDLLSESEQLLLRRLAVFAGGWTLETAEQVCSDEKIAQEDILDTLGNLVDKSLVAAAQEQGETHYRILETVRQYAHEKLLKSGESEAIRNRHLLFFLNLAEVARSHAGTADEVEWHERIAAGHDNLRLALDWAQQSGQGAESGLRLVNALSDFWMTHGYLGEGRERASSALNHARSLGRTALYANVLCDAAWFAKLQGDSPGGLPLANEALGIFRELGDKRGISDALHVLGAIAIDGKDYALAENTLQEAFENRPHLTEPSTVGLLTAMGWAAFGLGDYPLARTRLDEALTLSLNAGNRAGAAEPLGGLAEVDLREGRYESASKLIEESLAIRRETGDKWKIGVALGVWAWIAALQQDWNSAFSRLKESAAVREEIGDRGGLAWCLEKLGLVALRRGNEAKATRIFAAAASIRAAIGAAMDPFDQSEYDRDIALLNRKLGEEEFKRVWNQGRTMTLEQAIALALQEDS